MAESAAIASCPHGSVRCATGSRITSSSGTTTSSGFRSCYPNGAKMPNTIQRELLIPQPREQVWRAITESASLAEWMFPNDFVPRVGHHFTFQVPPNPKMNFDGLVVRCEVLECQPPGEHTSGRLAFSWSAAGLVDTRV